MENQSLKNQIISKGMLPQKNLNILKVNFGDIDSDSDKYLYDYFLDDDFVNKIVYGDKYFVSGRKGTGKTALYRWIKYSEMKYGYICSNMNLTDLNQADFKNLSDDNKPANTVYQTIWEYTILCEIARLIVFDPDCYFHSGDYQDLRQYIHFFYGDKTLDMHKLVLDFTTKKGAKLVGPPLQVFYGKHENYVIDKEKFVSLNKVNKKLLDLITKYLIDNPEKRFILQFDGLDNDYNYESFDNYKRIIISLLTATYELNNKFKSDDIGLKIISYLRSDIFRAVHDYHPNSAKWTFLMLELDWSIKIEKDFSNSKLKKMIEFRIKKSVKDIPPNKDPFEFLFEDLTKKEDNKTSTFFSQYLKKTMFRPRDLIALCIFTQKNVKVNLKYNEETENEIRKEYLGWFWSEISNEINTIVNPETIKRFIQKLGNDVVSYEEGNKVFTNYCQTEKNIINYKTKEVFTYQELMEYLFKFGIIVNVQKRELHNTYFSVIRSPLVIFNYKLDFQVNECLRDLNRVHFL